jgi:S1-C subfamily serine protease
MKNYYIALLFQIVLFSYQAQASNIRPEIIDKAYKSSVTIEVRTSISAYNEVGEASGTGFINNIKQGFIITNRHVIRQGSVSNYLITFFNGQKAEARLKYYDGWLDFAILQVNPESIPKEAVEITFSSKLPTQNQSVFIVGNNEGQSFSFHDGYLSNLFSINGQMPQHTYVANLNVAGGSSGSPLLNEDGEAIGLNYGGGQTYSLSLKGDYVKDALLYLEKAQEPIRKHIGAICELYSLDQAVKHRNFPKELVQGYLDAFPNTRNNILIVNSTINNSPASGKLKSGDIIWEVDDKRIGASLYDFDQAMNSSKNEKIKLLVYRNGTKTEVIVDLYDINQNKIQQMVEFGGAIIFEADDFFSQKTGMPLKSLAIANISEGMSMSVIQTKWIHGDKAIYRIKPVSIGGVQVKDLNQLIQEIINLNQQKFTTLEFQNYHPYFQKFDGIMISDHENLTSDITLDSIDLKPRVFYFNQLSLDWDVSQNLLKLDQTNINTNFKQEN